MDEGKLTSVELTRAYIARIAALNKRGPGLNAVTQLNTDALQGRRAAGQGAQGRPRPRPRARPADPAQGPDRREGHVHVGGQLLAAQLLPGDRLRHGQEAARARRRDPRQARPLRVRELLRQPAVRASATSPARCSTRVDADQNPSGSSSGSGAAGAAALSTLTIGTETSGSIISPSQAQRPRRPAPDRRPRPRLRHRADLGLAGHGRPDGPHGRQRGDDAAVDRRSRPAQRRLLPRHLGPGHHRRRHHPAGPGDRAELHVARWT